jgi:hypothetical protein
MSGIEARFWELCDQATQHDHAHFRKLHREDASDCEVEAEAQASVRAMAEIVQFVEANPDHRETFVRCFCDLVLWKRPQRFDLVAFCMRRLRFPEIPELIHRDADAHEGTAYYTNHMNYWSEINHAYRDEVSTLDKVWEGIQRMDFSGHERSGAET